MAYTLPSINNEMTGAWTEDQRGAYNSMPYHLLKHQHEVRKGFLRWKKMCGTLPWTPGTEFLKVVHSERTPQLRQMAFPRNMREVPKVDVNSVREMTRVASLKMHNFSSPVFQFYNDFISFINDHVNLHSTDLTRLMTEYEDLFIRGAVFHGSPHVYLPGRADGEVVMAPVGEGNDAGTSGKTSAWLQAAFAQIKTTGLRLDDIFKALSILENQIAAVPRTSSTKVDDVSKNGIMDNWVLVCSGETFNQFAYDPFNLQNRNVNLAQANETFKGNLFGRVTCMLEDRALRFNADGSLPTPEGRILNANPFLNNLTSSENTPYNLNETIRTPEYNEAPIEVAFLCGDFGYKTIDIGAPPSAFTKTGPDRIRPMDWNGKLFLTDRLLIPTLDEAGNGTALMNEHGNYIKLVAQCAYGIVGTQPRNILPIFFKRAVGAQRVGQSITINS